MGTTEVTWDMYQPCIDAGACPNNDANGGDNGWGNGNRPVIEVSWDDTQKYIKWLNNKTGNSYRLPTESEWEYAARAGSTNKYSWGGSLGTNNANCDGCGSQWDDSKTAPVKSFKANSFGLYDMQGNVWEWVEDKYHKNYDNAPRDGSARTSGTSSEYRVLRGGSWGSNASYLRSAYRFRKAATLRFNNVGFRLAQDIE